MFKKKQQVREELERCQKAAIRSNPTFAQRYFDMLNRRRQREDSERKVVCRHERGCEVAEFLQFDDLEY